MNINPNQMKNMMKQMGMDQEEIPASKVIIKGKDKDFVFENPQVSKIEVSGQETWQILGDAKEKDSEGSNEELFSDEDVETVMKKADASEDEAVEALEDSEGDLAKAILSLKS